MVIGPLINLASDFISSLIPGSSKTTSQAGNQASPFAQVLSSVQQADSAPFETVTRQIAGYLENSAQSASANGNTALANRLAQLSTDFSNVSTTGQLPGL